MTLLRPRQVSCGCCGGGCICANHQDVPFGRPVTVCAYHRKHPHTHTTEDSEPDSVDRADAYYSRLLGY